MTWVKLDDAFPNHPKVLAAGEQAAWLYVCGLCYCSQHLTDGFIPTAALTRLTALPGPRKLAQKLVDVDLWELGAGGWYVHNYEDRQRSRAQVESEREAATSRQRRSRDKRRGHTVTDTARHAVTLAGVTPGVTPQESETETDLHQQPCSEPPTAAAVDDDENRPGTAPIDPVAVKVRAVFERCTDARMAGKAIANRDAYRRTVFTEFGARERELRDVIATHPTAPVSTLAGWMLGEQNSLHAYRDLRTVAS